MQPPEYIMMYCTVTHMLLHNVESSAIGKMPDECPSEHAYVVARDSPLAVLTGCQAHGNAQAVEAPKMAAHAYMASKLNSSCQELGVMQLPCCARTLGSTCSLRPALPAMFCDRPAVLLGA